ncbi:hypothetical protein [Streptomyces sp. NBC_01314]|uniref:hypothetical protein n=1 Tax=Streptomyces sp. NBC_01314 TaxID=2903821 RepID=UPI00308EE35E|nr:hypothetical protein OG622_28575 [Streptomyces sp. NBC_01314]
MEWARPFRLHLTDGRVWDGAQYPRGHVCLIHPRQPFGEMTVALSMEELLNKRHPEHPLHGARVQWADAQCGDQYPSGTFRSCGDLQPLGALRESGLLWLINRIAFHPRGLALALNQEEGGDITGWQLLAAEEGEPFSFTNRDDETGYRRAEATLRAALTRKER